MAENNTTEATFNFMQNIIDKLDEISDNMYQNNDIKSDSPESDFKESFKEYSTLVKQSHKNILASHKHESENLIKKLIRIKNPESKVINISKNYMLIGKDSPIKLKSFLFAFSVLLITWWGIKYIPESLLKNEELMERIVNYNIYYNYQFLKNLERNDEESAQKNESIMSKIKSNDSDFFEEYYKLVDAHNSKK